MGKIKPKERCALHVKESIIYPDRYKKKTSTGMVWLNDGSCYAHNRYDPITGILLDTSGLVVFNPIFSRSDGYSSWACIFPTPPQVLLIINTKGFVVAKEIIQMSTMTLDIHDDMLDVYDDHVYRTSFPTGKLPPYNEGSDISLKCVGLGSPSGINTLVCKQCNVSWWIDDEIVDDSFEDISPDDLTVDILTIKKLSRKYANSEIKCIISSSNSHKERFQLTKSVKLQLNLKPVLVTLSYNGSALSEGNEYKFTCYSFGSSPSSVVTWWVDNIMMNETYNWESKHYYRQDNMINLSNSTTTSTLKYTPTMFQNGKKLACRAENSLIQNSTIVAEATLNITHPPVAKLSFWQYWKYKNIFDIRYFTFECNITANPDFTMVAWKKDGNTIKLSNSNYDERLWQMNYYRSRFGDKIIFAKATKQNEGSYVCEATNSVGTRSSNKVDLKLRDEKYY